MGSSGRHLGNSCRSFGHDCRFPDHLGLFGLTREHANYSFSCFQLFLSQTTGRMFVNPDHAWMKSLRIKVHCLPFEFARWLLGVAYRCCLSSLSLFGIPSHAKSLYTVSCLPCWISDVVMPMELWSTAEELDKLAEAITSKGADLVKACDSQLQSDHIDSDRHE